MRETNIMAFKRKSIGTRVCLTVNMIDMDGLTWKVDKRDNLVEKRLKMKYG
ncbi:hypothetical protein A2U01_0060120, partial [Trifolium medium]|nr:hypothetical protein [Trifolium medium]